MTPAQQIESRFVTIPDGLALHVRQYGAPSPSGRCPVVCLPGLARTEADFEPLARALAFDSERSRQVLALDYRGRGRSDYDPDPARYTLPVELADLLAVLDALTVPPAVFVGTSRGGLLSMLLGAVRPEAIAGVVLNDIGPVIEPGGLSRIKGYVGKLAQPASLAEGAAILRKQFAPQFPTQTDADWLAAAYRTWRERDGRLVLTYDPALARTLQAFDPAQPIPPLWDAFDSLAGLPLLVIRGALSDILSEATVAEMVARRRSAARTETLIVENQGHAPLLAEPAVIGRIATFIDGCHRA